MRKLLLALPVLLVAAGCNGRSPAEPSAAGAATINGTINGMGTASGASASGFAFRPSALTTSGQGLVVTVVNSSIASVVTPSGSFVLKDVPAGAVSLRFSNTAGSADVSLTPVEANQTVDLTLALSDAGIEVESDRRSLGGEVQLEGRVESLPPVTSAGTLIVGAQIVTTSSTTKFFIGDAAGSFSDLAIGIRVHVKGQMTGPALAANSITIQNTNADLPVNINGIVKNLTGPNSAFTFKIDGREIHGDAATEFFGGSQFADLANDKTAEVKGLQRNGFVYAARIHVNGTDDDDDNSQQDESASIEGTLTSKNSAGTLLVVGGTTVHATSATDVRRRGDVQTLSVLEVGMTLHVVGTRLADHSIDARMIQIKDDEVGDNLEIQGSMGGLKGTCPSLTFSVNGFSIATNGSTTFTPACSEFKSGTKATVKGVVQSNGTILASSVVKN